VEVAVERDRVDLAAVGGVEVAEERPDVVPIERGVTGDPRGQVFEIARADEVAHPLRVEDERVEAVLARRHVEQGLVVDVLETDRVDVDRRAGELLEIRRPPLERLGDLWSVERQQIDRHPVEPGGSC
jgi:hypothetical protein